MSDILFNLRSLSALSHNKIVAEGQCVGGCFKKKSLVRIVCNNTSTQTCEVLDCILSTNGIGYDYLLLKTTHKLESNVKYQMAGWWIVDSYHQTMSYFVTSESFSILGQTVFTGQIHGRPIYPNFHTHVLLPNMAYKSFQLKTIQKMRNGGPINIRQAIDGDCVGLIFDLVVSICKHTGCGVASPSKEDIPNGSLIFWNVDYIKPTTTFIQHDSEFLAFIERENNLEWYSYLIVVISEQEKSILNNFNDSTFFYNNIDKINKDLIFILKDLLSKVKFVKEDLRWRRTIIEHVALKDKILYNCSRDGDVSDNDIIDALCRIFNIKVTTPQYNVPKPLYNQSKSTNNIQWGKILRIGAVFAIKAVARYLGSDADFEFGDLFGGDSDSNVDFGGDCNLVEQGYEGGELETYNENPLYTPQDYAYLSNQYNVPFMESRESLEQDLRTAQKEIDYYQKIIDGFSKSEFIFDSKTKTYKKNCQDSLNNAIKKACKITKKLDDLKT